MKNTKAIIFDMDGLLLDTERICFRLYQETAQQVYNIDFTLALYKKLIGRRLVDSRKDLDETLNLGDKFQEFCSIIDRAYIDTIRDEAIPLKNGVWEVLDFIKENDLICGVATSTVQALARYKLEKTGLLDRMHSVTSGDQVMKGKPAPDIFIKAAETLGVHPRECLVLEDSEAGIYGARAAGMTAVMIPDLKEPSEEIQNIASFIFPSLNAFLDQFQKELQNSFCIA